MGIEQHRKIYEKVCPICGDSFYGFKNKVVCSDKCRQRKRRQKIKI